MKVAVSGAGGRMGGLVAETIRSAPDLELGGLYDSKAIPDRGVSTDTEVVRGSDVVVEFTVPEVVMGNLERWRSMGVHGSARGRFLLDTIGELRMGYALADLVVIGRSFGDLHGSDMIEPVALGKATIVGPAVTDFRDIADALLSGGSVATD